MSDFWHFSAFVSFGLWLILTPGSYIRVNKRLLGAYSPERYPSLLVIRLAGTVWLVALAIAFR